MVSSYANNGASGDLAAGIHKLPTKIRGLDDILHGGIPQEALTLLSGGPGSGKTMLCMEFIIKSAFDGHPGIFLTFEESESAIRNYAGAFGWDIKKLEADGHLYLLSARIQPDAVISGDFDLQGLFNILKQKAASMGAKRLVIDAPDVYLRLMDSIAKERAELQSLHEWLRQSGMTTLMSVKSRLDKHLPNPYEFLDYMADCVICLDQRVEEQITTRRLRVFKYRGSAYGRNEYPFGITNQGIWIIPVTQASLSHRSLGEPVSSGVDGLDAILGGGYGRNSCALLTGNSGTGKTTFACSFVLSAVSLGERVLYIDFEESWDALVSCMQSAGLDMRTAMESGNLRFFSTMPESQGIEEHLIQGFRAIADFEPKHLIIDAISACRRMGSDQAAFDYLLRIIDQCKQKGITSLLTNLTSVMDPGQEITGIDLSSVIDTVVILRNYEKQSAFVRDLAVLKSRGRAHSSLIHEFHITNNGIKIAGKEASHVK